MASPGRSPAPSCTFDGGAGALSRHRAATGRRLACALSLVAVAGGCGTPSGHPSAQHPVAVTPPNPSNAVVAVCRRAAGLLPDRLSGLVRRPTAPASPLTAAWGDPPVVLRCGVTTPPGFGPGAELAVADGIGWFQQISAREVLWTAVQRVALVQLTAPTSYPAQAGLLVGLTGVVRSIPATAAG